MNLNCSDNKGDHELRQAVEEQLDLILKMEQQRKALKKQNKMLYQKLKQTSAYMNKYQKQTKQMFTETEAPKQILTQNLNPNQDLGLIKDGREKIKQKVKVYEDYGVQVQIQQTLINLTSSSMKLSKLSQAQSLLKGLQIQQAGGQDNQIENKKVLKKQKPKEQTKIRQTQQHQQDKNLASQMIKITKQLNMYKKQFKQMEHKYKLRDKEIKDLKKCIQNKNQALEKSRKEFNQLSIILNSQKFKSIKNLQQQVHNLRLKMITQTQQDKDSSKVKKLLNDLAQQYQDFKKQAQKKINVLISQLANKQKELTSLQNILKKKSNQS